MIAALLIAVQTPEAVAAAHTAYDSCVQAETLRLGKGNQETADTILIAVRARCQAQWYALKGAFPSDGGIGDQLRDDALAGWQRDSEGRAIAALLEARAKNEP